MKPMLLVLATMFALTLSHPNGGSFILAEERQTVS